MARSIHIAAAAAIPPSGMSSMPHRRRIAGLSLTLLGLAVAAALADHNGGLPGTVPDLTGSLGAVTADLLYRHMGVASWPLCVLLVGWGWRLGAGRQAVRWGLALIAAPTVLGLTSLALAVLWPLADWPHESGLGGGIMGDVLYGALVPKVAYATGLGPRWVGLLAALLAVAAIPFAFGGSMGFPPLREFMRRDGVRAGRVSLGAQGATPAPSGFHGNSRPIAPEVTPRRRCKAAGAHARTAYHGMTDPGSFSDYRLPDLALLSAERAGPKVRAPDEEEMALNARLVESVLADFGVNGKVVGVRPGPVVTLYEYEPAPGIKSSRVIGLADDIARSMSAASARVAVIRGRNVIGIEIPNKVREAVPLGELLASEDFTQAPAGLTLALGKNIGGAPVLADLAAMPHLLVAGTTGSGKSVGINAMILSLLYRLTPRQCRFIMIDPKRLELTAYDDIPHLLAPVVTDPDKAVAALNWTVREMELRYRAMSEQGARSIAGYNARVAELGAQGLPHAAPLPHIVVVIDEIADLMLTAGKEVETAVQRMAQMARAAGIHLIMATQRPSTDVITGTLKSNFPARISFQMASRIDSRTVLGEGGAEHLLGQGDMLHMAGGGPPVRVHGAFVSEEEVEAVTGFVRELGAPNYVDFAAEDGSRPTTVAA
ncbi:MAG: DNA translocase FtsK 4TM domain-containing protein [Alphaproteobacteria bacterium]